MEGTEDRPPWHFLMFDALSDPSPKRRTAPGDTLDGRDFFMGSDFSGWSWGQGTGETASSADTARVG